MMTREKGRTSRRNKARYRGGKDSDTRSNRVRNINSNIHDDAMEGDNTVGIVCKCFSVCHIFGSSRRRHKKLSPHDDKGYESGMSKSSIRTPTTDRSSFDSPKFLHSNDPFRGCGIDDETSRGSADTSSKSELAPLVEIKSSISLIDPVAIPNAAFPLDGSVGKERTLKSENWTSFDTADADEVCSDDELSYSPPDDDELSYSQPDEDEFIEHQLDEMSNQSSILSFDVDDFMEDDHDTETYIVHVDNCHCLKSINEETVEVDSCLNLKSINEETVAELV